MPVERIPNARPGPRIGVLPVPPPAGQLPPEDSRLWMFTPKAITNGERWIQDDTREWFEEQDRKVQVCRAYPTHPRWMVGPAGKTARGSILNGEIVSEVHLLVRITAGLPDVPPWVAVRLSQKQLNADLAYRLTKTARGVFLEKGKQAMIDFAERSPGQFTKFVASTFIPKQIESNVTVTPGQMLDPDTADQILAALGEEMKRREEEARLDRQNPADYPVVLPVIENLTAVADKFNAASGVKNYAELVDARLAKDTVTKRLKKVIDLEADVIDPVTGEIVWD